MIEREFIDYAQKFHMYHKNNNIKKANMYAKKMHALQNTIKDDANYRDILDKLLICSDKIVRIWTCCQCIDLNYRKDDAFAILNVLKSDTDEIISRDARMLIFVKTEMKQK